jgi:hypothetical protein
MSDVKMNVDRYERVHARATTARALPDPWRGSRGIQMPRRRFAERLSLGGVRHGSRHQNFAQWRAQQLGRRGIQCGSAGWH